MEEVGTSFYSRYFLLTRSCTILQVGKGKRALEVWRYSPLSGLRFPRGEQKCRWTIDEVLMGRSCPTRPTPFRSALRGR